MTEAAYNSKLNVGNSIFPGFNDKHGLLICGYEWGYNKHDQYLENYRLEEVEKKKSKINTFFNKSEIFNSPYDLRIIKWFEIFGNPLGKNGGCSDFDKCILQTNWCDYQDTNVKDYGKFLKEENIHNFIKIVGEFVPNVLIFMGSRQIYCLQSEKVKPRFVNIFGQEKEKLNLKKKDFIGRKFKIGFQEFEKVNIISMPHPSGSIGLRTDYIKLFIPEISKVIENYRKLRGV